jgi:hypothetical protein
LVWVTSPLVCSGDHTTCKQLQPITLLASVCLNLLMQLCNQSTVGLSLILLIRQPITPPLHHWNQPPMSLDRGPSQVGFIRQPITPLVSHLSTVGRLALSRLQYALLEWRCWWPPLIYSGWGITPLQHFPTTYLTLCSVTHMTLD